MCTISNLTTEHTKTKSVSGYMVVEINWVNVLMIGENKMINDTTYNF